MLMDAYAAIGIQAKSKLRLLKTFAWTIIKES